MDTTPSGEPLPEQKPEVETENIDKADAKTILAEARGKIWRNRILFGLALAVLFFGAIVGGAFAASVWFRAANEEEPQLKVGLMMPFSGGSSAMGYGTSKGVELAKQQLGANNIQVIQADSRCDPKAAVDAMNSLIEQGVVAVIGEGCSSATIPAVPIANNAKIPLISPSASSPALSIADDYFFRVIASDHFQGRFLAKEIYNRGARRVAIFYTNEPYGSGMNAVFREQFESLGGEIVATASAEPDVIDIQDSMQGLAGANPDALFVAPNSVVSGTAVLQVAKELNMDVPYFGADIFYDNTIISNAPDAVEGLIVSTFPTGSHSFKQALAAEYQSNEQLYAASQAYDAFEAVYRAIQMGARTGEEIKNTLPQVSFEGVSAFIQFDHNGEISYDQYRYDMLQVRNREFVLLEPGNQEE